jgi:hypothetical protein
MTPVLPETVKASGADNGMFLQPDVYRLQRFQDLPAHDKKFLPR